MKANIRDRILLLLSIKEEGKYIDFEHIFEKVSRDEKRKISKEEIVNEINSMINEGLILYHNGYAITEKGMKKLMERLPIVGDQLNLSYRLVLLAKQYYPKIYNYIIPFLINRPVSVIKVFSDDEDPIGKIKPLFVRYARYKPKPIFISINNKDDLINYVNDHAIDFIPYVHKFDMKEPDWFIIDLDAGEGLIKEGLLAIKFIANEIYQFLLENEVKSYLKFSGSRGIQIWASFDNSKIPRSDLFATYRLIIQKIQNKIEERISKSQAPEELLPFIKKGLTTSIVAKKEERKYKVLLDWSSMKPYGDVRAPYSIHYKTGLISCPIDPNKVMDFQIEYAKPDNVLNNINKISKYFEIEKSNPLKLLNTLNII